MSEIYQKNLDDFVSRWERKKTGAIQKELAYWRKINPRHEPAYSWNAHDKNPDELSEGDRINILRDILRERENANVST